MAATPRSRPAGLRISLGSLLFPDGTAAAGAAHRHPWDDYGDSPRDRLMARLDGALEEDGAECRPEDGGELPPTRGAQQQSAKGGKKRRGRRCLPTSARAGSPCDERGASSPGTGGSSSSSSSSSSNSTSSSSSSTDAPSEDGASQTRSRAPSEDLASSEPLAPALVPDGAAATSAHDERERAAATGGADVSCAPETCSAPVFEEGDTTVMLRNIPNRLTAGALKSELQARGFQAGVYDFFYMPVDFGTKRNLGYCFVNFSSATHRERFADAFHGQRFGQQQSSNKILEVVRAATQGYEKNFAQFRRKDARHIKNECFKPQIFR